MDWPWRILRRSVRKTPDLEASAMTFKRKSAQELIRKIDDDLDPTDQTFWAQQRADRRAELRGALRVGELYAQATPGTFATEAYRRLSDAQEPLSADFLKLLQHLGEA